VALGYELLVAVEEIRTGALVDDVLVAVETLARLGALIGWRLPFPTISGHPLSLLTCSLNASSNAWNWTWATLANIRRYSTRGPKGPDCQCARR
jgi:hypothetical protein